MPFRDENRWIFAGGVINPALLIYLDGPRGMHTLAIAPRVFRSFISAEYYIPLLDFSEITQSVSVPGGLPSGSGFSVRFPLTGEVLSVLREAFPYPAMFARLYLVSAQGAVPAGYFKIDHLELYPAEGAGEIRLTEAGLFANVFENDSAHPPFYYAFTKGTLRSDMTDIAGGCDVILAAGYPDPVQGTGSYVTIGLRIDDEYMWSGDYYYDAAGGYWYFSDLHRGVWGTTAAAHSAGAEVYIFLVFAMSLNEALAGLLGETSIYGRWDERCIYGFELDEDSFSTLYLSVKQASGLAEDYSTLEVRYISDSTYQEASGIEILEQITKHYQVTIKNADYMQAGIIENLGTFFVETYNAPLTAVLNEKNIIRIAKIETAEDFVRYRITQKEQKNENSGDYTLETTYTFDPALFYIAETLELLQDYNTSTGNTISNRIQYFYTNIAFVQVLTSFATAGHVVPGDFVTIEIANSSFDSLRKNRGFVVRTQKNLKTREVMLDILISTFSLDPLYSRNLKYAL